MNIRHAASLAVCTVAISGGVLISISNKASGSFVHPALADSSALPPSTTSSVRNGSEPTDRQPEVYQGSYLYTSAPAMLAALGVTVAPEDRVFTFPDPALGIGSSIRVYRASRVTLTDGNNQTEVRTWASSVDALLKERHIELGDKDIVTPGLSVAVPAIRQSQPFTVVITRVAETQLKVDQSIDYSIQYVDAPDLLRGQQQVQQAGREGNRELTYLVHRENGTETWRKLTDSTVTQAPVAEIIRRGTKVVDYGTGLASWYSGVGSLTAAHRTLPLGTRVRVVNTATGASVVVTIADRGPFVGGRIIDLSSDAFAAIASRGSGVVNVRLEKP